MSKGRIKYYNVEKGFGFVAQDGGGIDVFIHNSSINSPYDEIRVGQRVKYKLVEGEKGPIGEGVEILLTPLERRWLRQGKNLIPREGMGVPPQHSISEDGSPQTNLGALYFNKQIRQRTSMFFKIDGADRSGRPLEFSDNFLLIAMDGEEQKISKERIEYCYKSEDIEGIRSAMRKTKQVSLKEALAEDGRLNLKEAQRARRDGQQIRLVTTNNETFCGYVDWAGKNEVKLILSNRSKIVIFHHSIGALKIIPLPVP